MPSTSLASGLVEDRVEAGDLVLAGRHHQLAAFAVGDLPWVEEGVERAPPLDAEPGLQRPGRIVEPAVDDLGVARGNALADVASFSSTSDDQPALRQRPAAGQAHGACAHHGRVEIEFGHGRDALVQRRELAPLAPR
jgi:hypothetical protein